MQDPAAQHRRAGIPFPALPARIELRAVRMPRRHQRAIRQPQRPPVGGCRGQVGLHGVVVWNDLDFPSTSRSPACHSQRLPHRSAMPWAVWSCRQRAGPLPVSVAGSPCPSPVAAVDALAARLGREDGAAAVGVALRRMTMPPAPQHQRGALRVGAQVPARSAGRPRRWRRRNPSRRPVPRRAGSPARRRGSPRHSCRRKLAALASADDEGGMRPLGAGQGKAASVTSGTTFI